MFCDGKDKNGPAIRMTYERDGRRHSFESVYFDEGIEGLIDSFVGMLVADTWAHETVLRGLKSYVENIGYADKQEEPRVVDKDAVVDYIEGMLEGNHNGVLTELNRRSLKRFPVHTVTDEGEHPYDTNSNQRTAYFEGLKDAYKDILEHLTKQQ